MNITDFTSEIFKKDLARDNLFKFTLLKMPQFLVDAGLFTEKKSLSLYIKGVTFSPNSVTSNPRLGDGYKQVKIAQTISHESDLEITFLVDANHTHYKLFEEWITNIMEDKGDTVKYFDDYTGSAYVWQYDRHGTKTTSYKFEDIYPISMGPKVYTTGTVGAPSEVTVNFSYRDMTIT